ncbi:LOW QUALITY PROTEIN: hypothetical protein NC652_030356 [Populus alba x Populus x berolinensis]|nr:LOW QUALITY PROTEIN: hypothetical protein NC652_030356 [Populus alba x Populus x berolinensis]
MEKMGTAEPNFEQLIVRRRSAFGTPSFPSRIKLYLQKKWNEDPFSIPNPSTKQPCPLRILNSSLISIEGYWWRYILDYLEQLLSFIFLIGALMTAGVLTDGLINDSISQLGQVLNEISSGLSKGLLCPYGLALLSTMGITHGKKPS